MADDEQSAAHPRTSDSALTPQKGAGFPEGAGQACLGGEWIGPQRSSPPLLSLG